MFVINFLCEIESYDFSAVLERFEKMLNIPCPAHGLRRIPMVSRIRFVEPGYDKEQVELEDIELDRRWQEYRARIADDDRLKRESQTEKNDAGEL